ncbi:uncharacterized protein LOC115406773 [Salarias fasciatus]|uniref:uncharacterized protein LOC115406773 n=1 Tax=Salarias fasciatus TaxID=181472 RepID=UPI001176AB7D|nr:uncharacterized protein LOC115406773 [Salarias fasciatus]
MRGSITEKHSIMSLKLKIMPRFTSRRLKMAATSDSLKPLMEKNTQDSQEEQRVQMDLNTVLQDLPVILDVPRSGSSEAGTIKEQCNSHMMMFWTKIITQPPQNLEENLQEHLRKVEEDVVLHLKRLRLALEPHGLMGYLEDCCHRRMIHYLQSLLQRVSSSRSCFKLLYWARHTYLRIEEFSNHDDQKIDGWDEWETKAKDKLFPYVQKELQGHLDKILEDHKVQETCDNEESYVKLYVDVVQCTDAMFDNAKLIDQELSDRVLQVCSQELLAFAKRYIAWQREFLKKQPETVHFLKTLRTCRGIRTYVQDQHMKEETAELLTEMETFTRGLLTEVVTDDVEKSLHRYFKSDSRCTFQFASVENHFPQLDFAADEHKAVMGDIYKGVAHVYFKHLIGTSMRKLRKKWSEDIGTTVHEDAVELHSIISGRAKDVQQYNKLLLSIEEVLTCSDMEGMKLTMAAIQKECHGQSEDLQLLPDLLLWRGYPRRDVVTVMEALPFAPPVPRSRFWLLQSCWGFCC